MYLTKCGVEFERINDTRDLLNRAVKGDIHGVLLEARSAEDIAIAMSLSDAVAASPVYGTSSPTMSMRTREIAGCMPVVLICDSYITLPQVIIPLADADLLAIGSTVTMLPMSSLPSPSPALPLLPPTLQMQIRLPELTHVTQLLKPMKQAMLASMLMSIVAVMVRSDNPAVSEASRRSNTIAAVCQAAREIVDQRFLSLTQPVLSLSSSVSTTSNEFVTSCPSLRILVAEDHPVNSKVAVRILKMLKHTVDIAWNGLEAVSKCEEAFNNGTTIDMILMSDTHTAAHDMTGFSIRIDVSGRSSDSVCSFMCACLACDRDMQMPEMDGLDAARVICTRWPTHRPRICGLTANATPADRERCLAAGMDWSDTHTHTHMHMHDTIDMHGTGVRSH